jgi:hypothetical protein
VQLQIIFLKQHPGYELKLTMMVWLVRLHGQHPWDNDGKGDGENGDGSDGLCRSVAQVASTVALLGGAASAAALLLGALSILEAISGHVWNKQRLRISTPWGKFLK